MPAFDGPRHNTGADDGFDDEPDRQTIRSTKSEPHLEGQPPPWLILERGGERLVLFCGWPEPSLVRTFRQMTMTIGLVLEGQDLALPGHFDDCDYVFIGTCQRPGSALADALRDLSQARWRVDRDASWPVIIGGYQPGAVDDRHRRRSQQPAAAEPDARSKPKPVRMEA